MNQAVQRKDLFRGFVTTNLQVVRLGPVAWKALSFGQMELGLVALLVPLLPATAAGPTLVAAFSLATSSITQGLRRGGSMSFGKVYLRSSNAAAAAAPVLLLPGRNAR